MNESWPDLVCALLKCVPDALKLVTTLLTWWREEKAPKKGGRSWFRKRPK